MNQILMAAAHGARIQLRVGRRKWEYCDYAPFDSSDSSFAPRRIHPNDDYLRFGPVSEALREFAKEGVWPDTLSGLMAEVAFRHECEYPFVLACEWKDACTFALVLSEALADKGL